MKVYTVESTDRLDYDFSFEQRKLGCFYDRNKAIQRAKEEFKEVKKNFAKEIKEYKNAESGATWIEEDDKIGYYCVSFGEDEFYESHQVCVEEWAIED